MSSGLLGFSSESFAPRKISFLGEFCEKRLSRTLSHIPDRFISADSMQFSALRKQRTKKRWGERTRLCKKSPAIEANGRVKAEATLPHSKTPRIDVVPLECESEAVALAAADCKLKVFLHSPDHSPHQNTAAGCTEKISNRTGENHSLSIVKPVP